MKIAVLGAGPLALVVALCFAERGHDVLCADPDERGRERDVTARFDRAVCRADIHPELAEQLRPHGTGRARISEGRLRLDRAQAVAAAPDRVVFVAVGSPPRPRGRETGARTIHETRETRRERG